MLQQINIHYSTDRKLYEEYVEWDRIGTEKKHSQLSLEFRIMEYYDLSKPRFESLEIRRDRLVAGLRNTSVRAIIGLDLDRKVRTIELVESQKEFVKRLISLIDQSLT